MIHRQSKLPISAQAKLLGLSRGSIYYLPKPISDTDLTLMRRIDRLHLAHPALGARSLCRQLRRLGYMIGRKHCTTLMRRMGIAALAPQPCTSQRCKVHKVYPYLLRHLQISSANQVWALDTTYIPMPKGFAYLTAVVDIASRKVLAHKTAITLEASHAVDVFKEAVAKYGIPEIVNTDQGSQFTAQEFVDAVQEAKAKLSMDGKGAWRDNVFVERLWRSVKYERVYLKRYESVSEARRDVADYIQWYNTQRPHSSLQDQTPDEAYYAKLPAMKEAA